MFFVSCLQYQRNFGGIAVFITNITICHKKTNPISRFFCNNIKGVFIKKELPLCFTLRAKGDISSFEKSLYSYSRNIKFSCNFRTAYALFVFFTNLYNLFFSKSHILFSQIYTKRLLGVNCGAVRKFYNKAKKQITFVVNQIGLTTNFSLFQFGIFTKNNGNFKSSVKTKYRDSIKTDRKSTRLNSSHITISYAVFCLKKKKN